MTRRALLSAAIFGLVDGLMSILGVVLDLRTHPGLVLGAALLGAVSAGLSMAVGQYLADNEAGAGAAGVLGLATAAGTVLPALPYAALHGAAAIGGTGAVCAVLALVVAWLRAAGSWRRGLLALGMLAAVFAVTLGCALAAPGGGA